MHQFVVRLLILIVLATNVAWALDDCCSFPYSNEASGMAVLGDLSSDSQDSDVCDEPCIGWLHLAVIAPLTKLDYYPFIRQNVARFNILYHSLDQEPLYRPPQI